jgi:hypothetical protein
MIFSTLVASPASPRRHGWYGHDRASATPKQVLQPVPKRSSSISFGRGIESADKNQQNQS